MFLGGWQGEVQNSMCWGLSAQLVFSVSFLYWWPQLPPSQSQGLELSAVLPLGASPLCLLPKGGGSVSSPARAPGG